MCVTKQPIQNVVHCPPLSQFQASPAKLSIFLQETTSFSRWPHDFLFLFLQQEILGVRFFNGLKPKRSAHVPLEYRPDRPVTIEEEPVYWKLSRQVPGGQRWENKSLPALAKAQWKLIWPPRGKGYSTGPHEEPGCPKCPQTHRHFKTTKSPCSPAQICSWVHVPYSFYHGGSLYGETQLYPATCTSRKSPFKDFHECDAEILTYTTKKEFDDEPAWSKVGIY